MEHTDDSEVTCNLCLSGEEEFDGGELCFGAARGEKDEGDVTALRLTRGNVVLHSGRQLHSVSEVTRGERFVFITWTRDYEGFRSRTCPCCFLNGRKEGGSKGGGCICGSAWN